MCEEVLSKCYKLVRKNTLRFQERLYLIVIKSHKVDVNKA